MLTIINKNTNPEYNLALEEYIFKYLDVDEDIFLVWRNSKSVIIGRNQNPFNEVDLRYAQEKKIPVLRRVSGGGTVFHDLGNINFSYITKDIKNNLNNYKVFLLPIINFLRTNGIESKFVEKSHIYVDDYKISGNAQSYYKDKMIHHGTLLYDVSLKDLTKLLNVKSNITSKSIVSKIVKTTNIKKLLKKETSIESFMNSLLIYILKDQITHSLYVLTKKDNEEIEKLIKTKYSTWAWNFGQSPKFTIQYTTLNHTPVDITVEHGFITNISTDNPEKLELLNNLLLKSKFSDENVLEYLKSKN